jgi:hypothetical protein
MYSNSINEGRYSNGISSAAPQQHSIPHRQQQQQQHLDYPNLQSCHVIIRSEQSIEQPPIRLPNDILQQVQQNIPKPIDFTTGKYSGVLAKIC